MVGFDPQSKRNLKYSDYATAGAISGAISRAMLQPLDVIKIRLQLQVEPVSRKSPKSKYFGFSHVFSSMLHEEGIRSLWKGHIPAQFLTVFYGLVQFSSFEFFTKISYELMPNHFTERLQPVNHMICGSLAGGVSTIVVQPMDVIRTRFIAQGEPKIYNHFHIACIKIVKNESIFGLWRGIMPSLMLVIPQTGLQFGFHRIFTSALRYSNHSSENLFTREMKTFVSGVGSGICSKLVVYPFDVVKKRLQVQGFEEARANFGQVPKYTGTWHCFKMIFVQEGLQGFYKGLFPTLLKSGSISGVTFAAYEIVCHILAHLRT